MTGGWSDPIVAKSGANASVAPATVALPNASEAIDDERAGVTMRVAAVQTVSGGDVEANLAQAEPLIRRAAAEGARLVVLPEYFGIFGARATDKLAVREADGDGRQQAFLATARAGARDLAGGRHGADRERRSGACAQCVPCLRPRRAARCAIRQDPSVRVRARRGTLRRRQDDRARQRRRGDRAAVRPGRVVGVLRPALSRALPQHGNAGADPGTGGVYGDDGRRALASSACAPAPSRINATCSRRRRAESIPADGAPTATPC